MLLNNQWVIEEIREKIKKNISWDKNVNTMTQKSIGLQESSSKRDVYSDSILTPGNKKNLKQTNLS